MNVIVGVDVGAATRDEGAAYMRNIMVSLAIAVLHVIQTRVTRQLDRYFLKRRRCSEFKASQVVKEGA
jgi:hypothetical protein